MIKVFNVKKILKVSKDISIERIKNLLENEFSFNKDINIVFTDQEKIRGLNKEYRSKDEVTDVLSFNIDSNDILGEIYICPEYVINNIEIKKFKEEIIRLLIHGILHLKGLVHKKKFDEVDYKDEPMYIKQEEILNKILRQLIQK